MEKNRTKAFSILLIMSIMLVGIPYANAAIDEKYVMADNLYNSANQWFYVRLSSICLSLVSSLTIRICSRQYDSVDSLPH